MKRERLMNGIGIGFVLSATVGFLAWAIACASCVAISAHDNQAAYAKGLSDGAALSGGDDSD